MADVDEASVQVYKVGSEQGMKISFQTDRFNKLDEIARSVCDWVRFGSEFCEWKIPSLDILKEAYRLTHERAKKFSYIIPRVSDRSLERIRKQLAFLDSKGNVDVVINDFGILNMLEQYPNLRPHLGRQLVYMPARCPWLQNTLKTTMGYFERRRLEKIYYQTSLNYVPTIHLYQKYGVEGVDVDWIPRSFPYFEFLIKNGLSLSIYTHLIPVAVTKACHTARFLGESDPEICSEPCNRKAFLLSQKTLGLDLYLNGNVVYSHIEPSLRDVKGLFKQGICELVVTVNPITKIDSREKIDEFIQSLNR